MSTSEDGGTPDATLLLTCLASPQDENQQECPGRGPEGHLVGPGEPRGGRGASDQQPPMGWGLPESLLLCPIQLHLQNTNSKLKFNHQNHSRKSLKAQMLGPFWEQGPGHLYGWPVRQPGHLGTLDQSRGPPASTTTILPLLVWPNPCPASRRVWVASLGFSLYKAGTVSHL